MDFKVEMAGATGLEPATYGVTGRHSNQLSYAPAGVRVLPRRSADVRPHPYPVKKREKAAPHYSFDERSKIWR